MTNTEFLDATGLLCPLPVLKARKRLKLLEKDAVLEIHADDPAAVVDFPHFCVESGNELVEIREIDDGSHIFVIRKS